MRISDWSSDVCSSDLTDPAALADLPLGEILPAAAEVEGRDFYERVRRAPFRGLTETQPIRALGALTNAMRNGQFEPHAWTSLINARGEKLSPQRMLTRSEARRVGKAYGSTCRSRWSPST